MRSYPLLSQSIEASIDQTYAQDSIGLYDTNKLLVLIFKVRRRSCFFGKLEGRIFKTFVSSQKDYMQRYQKLMKCM